MKTRALLLPFLCLPACGGQVVAWGLDAEGGTCDAPLVIATVPMDSATAVGLTTSITATFSGAMDAETINATTFTLRQGSTPVSGAVTFDEATDIATLTPFAALELDRLYTVTITRGARDTEGRALAAEYVWSFASGNIEVLEAAAAAATQSVPAPDYLLTVDGLTLLTDANDVVQSATGAATLIAGLVAGQRYVVVDAAGLDSYAEIHGAYAASADATLTASIPAGDFALVGADLTTPGVRTLILANIRDGVAAYQAFEITFHPAR